MTTTVVLLNTQGRDLCAVSISPKIDAQALYKFQLSVDQCKQTVIFSNRALLVTEQEVTETQLEAISSILYG